VDGRTRITLRRRQNARREDRAGRETKGPKIQGQAAEHQAAETPETTRKVESSLRHERPNFIGRSWVLSRLGAGLGRAAAAGAIEHDPACGRGPPWGAYSPR